MQPPMMTSEMQRRQDADHLRILAIFHFILAGLSLLGAGIGVLEYAFIGTLVKDPRFLQRLQQQQGPNAPTPEDMKNLVAIMVWVFLFFGGALLVYALLNFLSGIFLLKRKARFLSLLTAALDCLLIPIGTILGIFTLLVLNRTSVRNEYEELATAHLRGFQ